MSASAPHVIQMVNVLTILGHLNVNVILVIMEMDLPVQVLNKSSR